MSALDGVDLSQAYALPEQPAQVEWTTDDSIYLRHIFVREAGGIIPQHGHQWGHHTVLASGAVKVWKNGKVLHERLDAPAMIFIEAKALHAFGVLLPNTSLVCVHNLHGEEAVKVLQDHRLV